MYGCWLQMVYVALFGPFLFPLFRMSSGSSSQSSHQWTSWNSGKVRTVHSNWNHDCCQVCRHEGLQCMEDLGSGYQRKGTCEYIMIREIFLYSQVLFFVAEDTVSIHPEMPLVRLKGVDDTYPPQKKSFAMVKWMADNMVSLSMFFIRSCRAL